MIHLLCDLVHTFAADRLQRGAGEASQLALQRLATMCDVLVLLLVLEPLANLVSRLSRCNNREPVAARSMLPACRHHLNNVA